MEKIIVRIAMKKYFSLSRVKDPRLRITWVEVMFQISLGIISLG